MDLKQAFVFVERLQFFFVSDDQSSTFNNAWFSFTSTSAFRSALPICDLKKMYVCNISTSFNAKYLIASVIFDLLKNFLLIGCLLENRGQFSTETFMQITKKETRRIDETTFLPWICRFQLFWMRKKKNFECEKIEWKKDGFSVSDPYQFDWKGVENSVNRKGINRNIPSQHCIPYTVYVRQSAVKIGRMY